MTPAAGPPRQTYPGTDRVNDNIGCSRHPTDRMSRTSATRTFCGRKTAEFRLHGLSLESWTCGIIIVMLIGQDGKIVGAAIGHKSVLVREPPGTLHYSCKGLGGRWLDDSSMSPIKVPSDGLNCGTWQARLAMLVTGNGRPRVMACARPRLGNLALGHYGNIKKKPVMTGCHAGAL